MAPVDSLPADRKALLFSAGGVRLALRVSQLREIVEVEGTEGEVRARGETIPAAFVSAILGLPAGPAPYAVLTEGTPRAALRVEALHGIVDLAGGEVFQLPARTLLPQPPPFSAAVVHRGEVALELAVSSLGFAPLQPAEEVAGAPADVGLAGEREIRFARGARVFAVPMTILLKVLEAPRVAPVPLAPPSHRGLVYHERALHPVLDLAPLHGDPAEGPVRAVILVDAGGAGVGIVADRILGAGEPAEPVRPPWDTVFGA